MEVNADYNRGILCDEKAAEVNAIEKQGANFQKYCRANGQTQYASCAIE